MICKYKTKGKKNSISHQKNIFIFLQKIRSLFKILTLISPINVKVSLLFVPILRFHT